jgi:hypothetical protein
LSGHNIDCNSALLQDERYVTEIRFCDCLLIDGAFEFLQEISENLLAIALGVIVEGNAAGLLVDVQRAVVLLFEVVR